MNDALEAVLADFGQSRFIHNIPSPYVTEDILLGTPRYMAPELMEDETAQHTLASDIYAFSLVALEVSFSCFLVIAAQLTTPTNRFCPDGPRSTAFG